MSDMSSFEITAPITRNPHGTNQYSCEKPGHDHRWATQGELMIERCEHFCLFCTGQSATRRWKSAWHLRRHVENIHRKDFPSLVVSEGWSTRPNGNTRPINKKQRAPGSNRKRAGTKKSKQAAQQAALQAAIRAAQYGNPTQYNLITTGVANGLPKSQSHVTNGLAPAAFHLSSTATTSAVPRVSDTFHTIPAATMVSSPVSQSIDTQLVNGLASIGIESARMLQSANTPPAMPSDFNVVEAMLAQNERDLAVGNAIINQTQQSMPYFVQEMNIDTGVSGTVKPAAIFRNGFASTPALPTITRDFDESFSPITSSPTPVSGFAQVNTVDPVLLGGGQQIDTSLQYNDWLDVTNDSDYVDFNTHMDNFIEDPIWAN